VELDSARDQHNEVSTGWMDGWMDGAHEENRTPDLRITRTFDFVCLVTFDPSELALFASQSVRCRYGVLGIPEFLG
jgi:hypothetical protein